MGVAYRPRDLLKGRRHVLKQGLKDIGVNSQENVLWILQNWEGQPSEEKLMALLGEEKARRLKELLNL